MKITSTEMIRVETTDREETAMYLVETVLKDILDRVGRDKYWELFNLTLGNVLTKEDFESAVMVLQCLQDAPVYHSHEWAVDRKPKAEEIEFLPF